MEKSLKTMRLRAIFLFWQVKLSSLGICYAADGAD